MKTSAKYFGLTVGP